MICQTQDTTIDQAADVRQISSERLPTYADPESLPLGEGPTIQLNLPKRRPSFDIETSGRNAPCPCGSGKKFKQCCGLEA